MKVRAERKKQERENAMKKRAEEWEKKGAKKVEELAKKERNEVKEESGYNFSCCNKEEDQSHRKSTFSIKSFYLQGCEY